MDPFFVLGVTPGATDAEVEARYRTLLAHNPPDRDPARFATLRAAYDALRTEHGRVDAYLFHEDPTGSLQELSDWLRSAPRKPPALEDLRALIRGAL
ncbi:MAG: hypothetical protein AMXMBFR64_42850 [Myxococcales bacterium]